MDHAQPPAEGLSVDRPTLRLHDHDDLPADFVPLRLVLQPSGAVLEATRPDMVIGRHTDADIRLPLPDVSRRHCRLVFNVGWQVIDLNSLNGIQVNGEQVLQAPLDQGDTLRVGSFTFAIDMTDKAHLVDAAGHIRGILETLAPPATQRRAS